MLTIAPQCIALELKETMANPDVPCTDEHPEACGNCFVCQKKIHGKEFKREEFKNLLFTVFCDRGVIEGERNATAVVKAIRKRKREITDTFNNKSLTCRDVEGTLVVLIAAGLIEYAITCDDEDNENVVLELAMRQSMYAM